MAREIRLFIAIPVSQQLIVPGSGTQRLDADASLHDVMSQLRSFGRSVKAVATESMHVTLKFIGEVATELVPEITTVLEDVAATESPFELQITGLGAFPTSARPSVVWAGLINAEPCARLKTALESRLVEFGIEAEARPFRPHLTLARIKARPPQELHQLLEDGQSLRFSRQQVRSIELVQSELKPAGPKYTTLTSACLKS